MVKTFKHKKMGKRLLAFFLTVLTVFGCFTMMPTPVQASKVSYAGHELHYHGGRDVYCIEYGKISDENFVKDADAVKYYNDIPYKTRNKINNIIRSASILGYVNSDDKAKFGAVQKAIWEVMGATTTWNDKVDEYYNNLKKKTNSFNKDITSDYVPSFAGERYELDIGTDKTITDENGVFTEYWSVSAKHLAGKGTVTTGSKDNTLVLNANQEIPYANRVSFEITSGFKVAEKISKSNADDYVGKMGSQRVIVAPDLNTITRGIEFYAPTTPVYLGAIQLYKVDDEGNRLSGVHFTCTDKDGNSYPYKATYWDGTSSSGKLVFNELPVSGNPYTIHEINPPDGHYSTVNDMQINVVAGEIVQIGNDGTNTWWINHQYRGNLIIDKNLDGIKPYPGATFELSNGEDTYTGVTDANGHCEFLNIKSGTYVMKEYSNNDKVLSATVGDLYIWNDTIQDYLTVKEYNFGWMVVIPENGTAYYTYSVGNPIVETPKRGDLRVRKTVETYYGEGAGAGFEMTITSTDNALGEFLQFTAYTGADGYAYFCDVPVGTYTISETNLDETKYIKPPDQTVEIVWDENYNYIVRGVNFVNDAAYFYLNAKEVEMKNTLKRGDLKVHKDVEANGGLISGENFEITITSAAANNVMGVDLTFTTRTDANGNAYFSDLPLGTYTVTETNLDESKYIKPEDQIVSVVWDGNTSYDIKGAACLFDATKCGDNASTTYVQFVNRIKRGDLRVYKLEEKPGDDFKGEVYENGKDFEVTITSAAADNVLGIDLTFTAATGDDGYAYFCDLPTGTYIISETNLDVKFVQPDNQTGQVVWDGNTSYTVAGYACSNSVNDFNDGPALKIQFTNYLKKFRVNVEKKDEETGTRPQGNSVFAGATYDLYKGDKIVGTYVTDKNGKFTTD